LDNGVEIVGHELKFPNNYKFQAGKHLNDVSILKSKRFIKSNVMMLRMIFI
jgi:hypothetical protein